MSSKYDFLKDVNPAKEDWRIKVKVVRTWKVPNFQRKNLEDNLEMVLLDEQGGRIHATVKDVIGLISGIGKVCDRVVSGRKTKMVVLELDDLRGHKLECTLWEHYVDEDQSFLADNDDPHNVTTCITYGTIKAIESKYNWWYKSCKKCPFSVYEDFEKWYCKNCQKHWEDYYPRFSVQVRVVDNTDSASFILFDCDCVSLLGMSAAELRELHFKRGADLDQFPNELNVLNEKSMLFKINVKQKDLNTNSEPKYQVSKICISEDIISAFIKYLIDPNDEANFDNARENEVVSSELEKAAVSYEFDLDSCY
ncbi:uncharacterized protein LOC133291689 [Gastrolobium bilobum]|uniref:uncharacterized protein LOC133291689 n=1 Tax=Gastrolobium bilobum TaxID=150636 RepID=UPI002AB2DE6C|nr:uncharacterized protein LOC133291689 [Gastrolobium bilobum]